MHTSTSQGTDPIRRSKGATGEFYRPRLRAVKSGSLICVLLLLQALSSGGAMADELESSRNDEERLAAIIDLVKQGEFAAAEEVLLASGGVALRDARWLNIHGLAVAGQGRHREAVGLYEEGLRRDPGLAALHRNLAISLVESGGRGRALTEFMQATELDPGDVDAWLGLCTLQVRLRRAEDAMNSWQRLHQLAPVDVRTWRAKAELADLTGERESGREAWLWLESRYPDAESARRLALLADDPDSVLVRYRDCVDRDPEAVDCREQATAVAMQAGDFAGALELSAPALEQLSEAGYLNLLLAALNSSNIREVEGWVQRRQPGLAESWGVVALVRRQQDRPQEALEAVQSGLELAETADLYNLLGVLRVERGDVGGARRAWTRALDLDPAHEVARSNLEEHPEAP